MPMSSHFSILLCILTWNTRGNKSLVDEVTTLWCHLKACHGVCNSHPLFRSLITSLILLLLSHNQGRYHNWAKGMSFMLKLPGDIKKRKAAAEQAMHTLDDDVIEMPPSEQIIPYSNKLFHQVVLQWLVATDQVCNVF
jgi:hypothetical protein